LIAEYGNDVAILYIEVQRTQGSTIILAQDCARYTAWNKGNFVMGAKRNIWCVVECNRKNNGEIDHIRNKNFPPIRGLRIIPDKGKSLE